MGIFKLYSKQKKAEVSRESVAYQYGYFPNELRVQLCHILDELVAKWHPFLGRDHLWVLIHKTLCREYGLQQLPHNTGRGDREAVLDFILNVLDVNKCMDVLQVTFAVLHQDNWEMGMPCFMQLVPCAANHVEEAFNECNQRFKEHGVGFQFVGGNIIKIDSEIIHQQVTMPALKILEESHLAGANEEFLTALDHHRHGRYKECLNECLKAFESTMKAICHRRNWPYDQNATAKTLISVCEKNTLFPVFMESHITGLRTALEAGVPAGRNKMGAHGQGVTPIIVSPAFATFILNLTASNIQFLAASEKALP